MQTRTVMRNELYAMVWSNPMRRLAKEFGVSDAGLAKICRKNDIPTPPLGYWAKKEHGKAVRQTPLPAAKSDTETAITITEQPAHLSEPLLRPRRSITAPGDRRSDRRRREP